MRLFLARKQKNEKKNLQAFSIVELLVSISIIGMMAAISISAYPKFSDQIGVSSESYKLLTYLKEAQVFGISSYGTPGTKMVYGVEISKTGTFVKRVQWVNPTNNRNSDYIANKVDSGEQTLDLKTSFELEKICDSENCTNQFDKAYIFYRRPNPEARIVGVNGTIVTPAPASTNSLNKLYIFIRSKKNTAFVKKVVILQTGQVYVSDW